ncbi:MAG: hypothetical protein S4CHLAM6_01500 [Chlamydiae bacterium]|nr:hypothetical protein [Chlamydiota bacterium]
MNTEVNSTFPNHVSGIISGAYDLMPWTFDPQTHFCATYQAAATLVKESAYLGYRIPNISPESYTSTAGLIGKIGFALFAIETLGDMVCYGSSYSEKGLQLLKNALVHTARAGLKSTEMFSGSIVNPTPFQVAASYLNLVDRKETHYDLNGQLDDNNLDLYASFHTAISTGKVDTVRLLVQQYKKQFPDTPISFKQVTGDMDGLFLALGTEKTPQAAIIQLFMETGCNPRAKFNGKTPLDLISTYLERNPSDLEAQHVKVYMEGMKKVIQDFEDGANTRSIEGSRSKKTASSRTTSVHVAPEGTCDGDEC